MDAPFPEGMIQEIETFLSHDGSRLPGRVLYNDVFDTSMFFPLQRQRELREMMSIAADLSPVTVMEIGSDKGGSLYHWCKCHPTVKNVIACEIRGTPYSSLFERAFPRIQFLWLAESSYEKPAVEKVRRFLGDTEIDCLFIDGDKLRFLDDFRAYLPFMARPGTVFMHDINDREPRAAFLQVSAMAGAGELKASVTEFIDITDSEAAMKREAKGIPPASAHESWLRHWKGRSCGVGVIQIKSPEESA
jgi:predicted O-methyltransferase YrrM